MHMAGERIGCAAVFPGHGSDHEGMRSLVEAGRPELLAAAREVVGSDPFLRLDEGTRFQQVAIFCASVAGWDRIAVSLQPAALAGHSLGEFAALVAAGSLDVYDALRLVALRGALSQQTADRVGDGMMLAVLGADIDVVSALVDGGGASIANDNGPEQVVVSGRREAVETLAATARVHGLRTLALSITVPFHTPEMHDAATTLRAALDDVPVAAPRMPVLSGVTAAPFDDVRERLALALVSPVRWREVVLHLHDSGIRRFAEVGPGQVLTRLIRRVLPQAEAWSVDQPVATP